MNAYDKINKIVEKEFNKSIMDMDTIDLDGALNTILVKIKYEDITKKEAEIWDVVKEVIKYRMVNATEEQMREYAEKKLKEKGYK